MTSASDSGKTTAKDTPDIRSERKDTMTRVPFGARRKRLHVPFEAQDPDYFLYWFRDQGDTIHQARRGGYEFVSFRDAKRTVPQALGETSPDLKPEDICTAHGGTGEGGVPYKQVLMRLPRKLREEDEAAHAKMAEAIDDAIYRPEFKDGKVVGNQYGSFDVQTKDKE